MSDARLTCERLDTLARSQPSHTPNRRRLWAARFATSRLVGDVGRGGEARIDLEVDVRPAPLITAGKDRRERHPAVGVRLLHATQVVLVGDAAEYSEYRPGRSHCQRYTARPASGAHVDAETIVSTTVSGTPSAVPLSPAKLERMSLADDARSDSGRSVRSIRRRETGPRLLRDPAARAGSTVVGVVARRGVTLTAEERQRGQADAESRRHPSSNLRSMVAPVARKSRWRPPKSSWPPSRCPWVFLIMSGPR